MVTPEADDWIFAFGGASWLAELVYKLSMMWIYIYVYMWCDMMWYDMVWYDIDMIDKYKYIYIYYNDDTHIYSIYNSIYSWWEL